jgi:hypothetical protein
MKQALFLLVAIAILGLGVEPGAAQTRVFVSGQGSDSNPCSLAAPCRSFQQAHNAVVAGGEIVALDAAGYGPITISKAVTITAIGIEASITTNGTTTTGVVVNAGAGDTVTIRGITLFSGAITGDGIDINSGKSVTIRDCTISGFPGSGIAVEPSASLHLALRGVTVYGSGASGLVVFPSGPGAVTASVIGSVFSGNDDGVVINGTASTGTLKATLSVLSDANLSNGISVIASGVAPVTVMITGSQAVNNAFGVSGNGANARLFVDRTQVSGNSGVGWHALGGASVSSYTNNGVNGNGTDGLSGVVQISSE